ncbi:MAG: hypothetical protein WA924_05665 [Burkholderiaceae bacterium]
MFSLKKYVFPVGCLLAGMLGAARAADTDPAAALRAKYETLAPQLQRNPFQRPLVLDSSETSQRLKGDIYARVDYPFTTVRASLDDPGHWCDMLLMHINTKYCRAETRPSGTVLKLNIGKKTPEPLEQAPRVEFDYDVVATTPDYAAFTLAAAQGPLGTSDYRIALEAVALPDGKSFLHLSYSYAMNFSARLAMRTYLGTVGRDKVGFTVVGREPDGSPDYVDGVRGVVERNTMRYYLAIDTFLATAGAAPTVRPERRFRNWFTAAEQYPRQLHEMERDEYLDMKRAEYARQQRIR